MKNNQGIRYRPNAIRDTLHRWLFVIFAAFGAKLQTRFLRLFFNQIYLKENPWGYDASLYQAEKAGQALNAIPRISYENVLEIGCGEGAFSESLLKHHKVTRYTGLDISASAIERAKRRNIYALNAQFVAENVFDCQYNQEFDLIIICEILYYLGTTIPQLGKRVYDWITPGGYVLMVHAWPDAEKMANEFTSDYRYLVVHQECNTNSIRPYSVLLIQKPHS